MKRIVVSVILSIGFGYLHAQVPTITGFSPTSGPIGTSVIITGTNFSTTPANNIVFFGAEKAVVTSAVTNQLSVIVPKGATHQLISITVSGLTAYSSGPFIVTFTDGGVIDACSFAAPVALGSGNFGYGVAIGDLDGDGKTDVAITDAGTSMVHVLRNTSTIGTIDASSFAASVDLGVGTSPYYGIVIADIDGDGKLDIVSAGYTNDIISIYRNTSTVGTLSFGTRLDLATGSAPYNVSCRDLDGDGKTDIAVGNAGGGSISIWQNIGAPGSITAGSFNPRLDIAGPASGLAIEDMDGDGKPDLIGGYNLGSAVGVSRNMSTPGTLNTGSFAPFVNFSVGAWPENIVVGDLDADNRPDIVTSSWPGNTISILKNTSTPGTIGAGSFAAAVDILGNAEPRGVSITDFDGDGLPDIGLSNQTSNVSIYKNANTPGSITTASFLPKVNYGGTGNARAIMSGDIDGDGKPDLVVANYGSPSLMILRNTVSSLPPPTITSLSTSSGTVGSPVTITGTNFSTTPLNNTVKFNGVTAIVLASTSTTITTSVPALATTGTITVSVGCNTATSASFSVLPLPTITSFSPTSGPIGTSVTINGTNFSTTPANNIVFFGATQAVVTAASTTQLTVTVPYGTTYKNITVTVAGITATSSRPFDVTFPTGNSIDACSFAPKIDYTTPMNPFTVAIGDIDGDGKPDLVTVSAPLNNFSVYTNTTSPGSITAADFLTRTDFPSGLSPNDVGLGDVDGDGKLDVVILTAAGNGLSVHRNTSTPGVLSFAARVDLLAGVNSRRVGIGDLDGDGRPELVVPNSFSVVSVFRNLCTPGNINFTTKIDFTVGTGPYNIEIGDLDGDGKAEMLVSTFSPGNQISVLRNTATPGVIDANSFQPSFNFSTGAFSASDIILSDLDGDSKPEVIAPIFNPSFNSLAIFRNTSTPGTIDATSLAPRVDYLMGTIAEIPYTAVVSDLDGDNKPDIAISRGQSTTLVTYRNVTTPGTINASSFTRQDFFSGPSIISQYSIAAGDLDADGKPELVITNTKLAVFKNLIAPPGPPTLTSFTPAAGVSGTPVTITGTNFHTTPANNIVTFNGVAATVTASTATSISTTVPAGATTGLIHLTIGGCYSVFSATSFNILPVITSFSPADGPIGTTVIITGSGFSPVTINNKVYFGGGKATVTAVTTTQLTVTVPQGAMYSAISVIVGGLTALSSTPFILTFPDGGVVNSCSFAPRVNYTSGASPHDVAVGDIDGDGRPDVATVNSADNTISVFRNTGAAGSINASTLAAKVDFTAGNTPVGLLLADVDGDGKLDAVVSNYAGDNIYFFRNTSTTGSITSGSFAAAVVLPTGSGPTYMAMRDLDGDGKPDLAVAITEGGFISVFRNTNSAGSITAAAFGTSVDFLTSSSDQAVVIEDMDGDNKPELVASLHDNSTVSIYKNQSVAGSITAGSFQAPVTFPAGAGANRLSVGDLDDDGKPDVVTANLTGNSISILKNTTTPGIINSSSLAAKVDFTAGTGPWQVSIGDVDGDSWPDLVSSNDLSSNISVFRNRGTGIIDVNTFDPKIDFSTGSDTRAVAIADMDGNGKPDLVAPNGGSTTVGILRNRVSSLPFMTATGYSPGSGPVGTVVTITGTNFSTTPINNTIKFNGVTAIVTASTSTSITTSVPAGATTGPISIEVGCNTATTIIPFTVSGPCITAAERNALIEIYNSTDGANWTNKTNWLSADESTWFGVTVSGCTVTKLTLPLNNLFGPIPPEIEDLPNLIELDLSHNSLTGALPPELGNLPDLQKLLLNINGLDSELPPEIGSLASLQVLNLSNNSFSLELPPELGDLDALISLNLSNNIFDDDIPDEFGNLVNLVEMDLSHNGLTGDVPPSFGNLLLLKKLILNDNFLVIVDAAVGPLPALEIIQLENNGVLSIVPAFTSTNITHLSLENNNLDFSDLEPNIGVAGYTYIPQNRLLPGGVLYFNVGATLTIPFTTGGTANSYQWYLGGAMVPGATSSTLVKPGMTFNDIGFYTLHITSAVVPGLTLVTENYQVMAFTDPCATAPRIDGTVDASFNPLVDAPTPFHAVKLQSTGKIIVSTSPTTVNSVAVNGVARFNADGSLDNTFTTHAYYPGTEALVVQPDDKILTTWDDSYGHVVRFNADGTDDVAFNTNAPEYYSGSVQAMAIQPDNKILIAHTLYLSPPTIDRINPDGTPDASFSAPADISAYVLRVQSDGKILASLDKDIVRLLPSGAIDPGFNVDVDEYVTDMVIQPDGKIIITGFFAFVNGVPHFDVARLNADGSTDNTFNPIGVTDDREQFHAPYKIALQSDGKILIEGDFSYWNGYIRETILRLNSDGTTDCSFDSGSGANGAYDMIIQADGKILISGGFDNYDGTSRNGLARISNSPPITSCLPAGERAALIALYTATNGAGWTNKTNWLSADESTWFGVTIASCHVTKIVMPNNNLIGPLPIQISNLPNLAYLDLGVNHLTGSIPIQFGSLSNMVAMDLSRNQLTGSIPVEFGNMGSLEFLELYTNQLTGIIPPQLGNATSLAFLRLSDNLLTGSIPTSIGNLTDLFLLDLDQNQLTGPIPSQIGNLTSMKYLNLYENQLSGPIPPEIGNLTALEILDIFTNQLTGSLPVELAQCLQLKHLEVANNLLTGTLPIAYQSLVNLETFQINDNSFTGAVPVQYLAWTNIKDLFMTNNQLDAFPTFPPALITNLAVENNKMEFGDLESSMGTTGYVYNPQAKLPGGTLSVAVGNTLTIPFTTSGTANQYQWYKDAVLIPGATAATFSKPSVTGADAGNYVVQITSTIVTGLTLSSLPFVVTVTGAINIAPQPVDFTACEGATATFTTNATGTTNITYQWQFSPNGPPAFVDISNGPNYSGATTNTLSVNTAASFGIGRYRCKVNGDLVATVFTNDAGLFINPLPSAPTAGNGNNCGTGPVTITAAGGVNGQYRWYTALTGGIAIAGEVNDTYITPIISTTTNYYVTTNNGTCESVPRTPVVATINSLPTSPGATNGSNCGTGTIVLGATGGVNGQYRWYTALTGGIAIAGEVNNSYTTPSIGITTTYFVTINNGTCESAPRIPVVATINTIPTAPGSTPGANCGPGPVILGATGGVNGQYRWYTALTGGTAIAGQVNSNYTTPVIAATTTYYVTINNGTCESTPRTTAVATINTLPTAPGGTPNSTCGTGTVVLGATGGVNGQYRWYTALTGGTAIAGEVNSNYTTPSISVTTTYFVTIDNGTCESSPRTPVIATINTVAKPVVVTSNCTTTSATLTGPNGFTGYAWSNGAVTQQIVVTIAGTYTLVVTAASGCSSPSSDPVIIAPLFCNLPPIIATTIINTVVEGKIELSIANLLSDPDNNLDLTTLKIFKQPTSGAVASIGSNATLIIDYKGKSFSGKDELTIEVCDLSGVCAQKVISVEVAGEIVVNNGISPNGNGQNDVWIIQYIEVLQETKDNHISVFNRWGDEVFETNNYNNTSRVFTGHNKNGDELPVGTYFYKIEFTSGRKTMTGYISLKR